MVEGSQSSVCIYTMNVKNIAFLANRKIPDIGRIQDSAAAFLRSAGVTIEEEPSERTDVLVTLGGDGTLLKGAHLLKNRTTLIYGIKFGRVGFLTNSVPDLKKGLERLLAGGYAVSERMALAVTVENGGTPVWSDVALNEALVTRATIRIAQIEIFRNKAPFARTRCDGVMTATPTGSTAHWLAAGGPVLAPELDAIGVLFVAPYTMAARPAILPPDDELRISADTGMVLVSDGQREYAVAAGRTVVVRRDAEKVRLLLDPVSSFFGKLGEKFGWST